MRHLSLDYVHEPVVWPGDRAALRTLVGRVASPGGVFRVRPR